MIFESITNPYMARVFVVFLIYIFIYVSFIFSYIKMKWPDS
ncbi:hypothetical protein B4146_2806 [Bacillus subtilis]|uniref:Uncharacterized protein n=1 Tax=Bacillus subtilis TaxID=1423 RepID=A0AAP1H8G2_BACIU|nr:hypothetical protein B4146_2806 [Bacillus subtilis]KZD88643.1 hypothetical protein B4122_4068 [Bacillus subtilis]KZD91905.1 hypothetical protein B4122_2547 [Bacillus subtilis]